MLAVQQPGRSFRVLGPRFLSSRVNVRDALAPLGGCTPAASRELDPTSPTGTNMHGLWCPYCYRASGMPAMPSPQPHPPPAMPPPRWPWERRMAQSSCSGERAASGRGSHRPWGAAGSPPGKGYSWLFYRYIYIFFVARYCYLTLALGAGVEPSQPALAP